MLQHRFPQPTNPSRVVVLGSGGFIGRALVGKLAEAGVALLGLSHRDLDLLDPGAGDKLVALLGPDDALVIISARAPCKTPAMLVDNVRMIGAVCDALARRPVAHLVYVSSDAVYGDEPIPITEATPAAPGTLHGTMHLAREQMLAAAAGAAPYAILRPSLVYGAADPHNGYGPNRFRRLANRGEPIVLFGEGEERRDHVYIDDVATLACLALRHRSAGVLNAATGTVVSFRDLAEQAVTLSPRKATIQGSARVGPMPHNGYRPFDPAATFAAFPQFRYTSPADGLARAQSEEFA